MKIILKSEPVEKEPSPSWDSPRIKDVARVELGAPRHDDQWCDSGGG